MLWGWVHHLRQSVLSRRGCRNQWPAGCFPPHHSFMFSLLLLLLGLLAGLALLVGMASYLLYSYEVVSTSRGASARRPPIPRAIVRGIAMSMTGQILVTLTYPLGLWERLWFSPAGGHSVTDDNPPLLLVHGLYHNASAWMAYRKWLREAGLTNVYAFSYSSWRTDFDTLVLELDDRIAKLEKAFPGTAPVLVGHSLGGLIIRGWIKRFGGCRRVRAVLTLGTPHQGSKLARLGFGRLCRSLAFRGPLVRALEKDEPAVRVPAVALYSGIDNMVLPVEGLKPRATGWRLHEVHPVSHIFMLYSKKTFDEFHCRLKETLAGGCPVTPQTGRAGDTV